MSILSNEELADLLQQRTQWAQTRDEAEEKVRALSDQITVELIVRGVDRHETQEFLALLTKDSTREQLDRLELIKAGVTADQLAKGTKKVTVKGSLRVTRRS